MAQLFFGGVCIQEGVKWSAFNIHIYLLPVWIAGLSSFQEGLFSIEPWGEQVDFFSLAVSGQTSTHQETTLQNGFHNSGLF